MGMGIYFAMRPSEAIATGSVRVFISNIFVQLGESVGQTQEAEAKVCKLAWQVADNDQTEAIWFRSKGLCDRWTEALWSLYQIIIGDSDNPIASCLDLCKL